MKRLIFFSLVLLVVVNGGDDIKLDDFEFLAISPTMANGTVSEHTPYMVSVRLFSEDLNKQFGYGHFCGGVFVTRKHILTLATCLKRSRLINPYELQVIAGTRYRYDNSDAKILSANKVVIHPDYNITDIRHNLAIIFLTDEVSSEITSIAPIKIADKRANLNENFQIFGWGTPLTNNSNRELQTGRITVTDRNACPQTFINRFCAGPSHFGGCQGDDGGAVASSGQLYGLIDYRSIEYCNETRPAHLYVDVFEYRDWIISVINDDASTTTESTGGSATQTLNTVLVAIAAFFTLKSGFYKHIF